jgi:triacylglycerol lipase
MAQSLDPKQAFFYGQFVQAAYTMFRNPQGPDKLRPEPVGIPDGYELGGWIHMSDFVLDIEELKFYGIVAHKIDDLRSRVIAIRGTEGAMEWIDDGWAVPVPFHQVPSAGRVACGFDKIYKTLKVVKYTLPRERGLAAAEAMPKTYEGSFADQLEQLAISHEASDPNQTKMERTEGQRPARPTVVTGHSLGAALCTLFVMENNSKHKFDIGSFYTFASPRVGNAEFVRTFNLLPINSWRIVNTLDLVPKLPPYIPVILDYEHVDTACPFFSSAFAKHSLLCYHTMETYLHFLDNTSPVLPQCKV